MGAAGAWIEPLGDVFLGLNDAAIIHQVVGFLDSQSSSSVQQVQGITWHEFVTTYAAQTAQAGLQWAWDAIVGGRVERRFWPNLLPFKAGMVARIHPVDNDPLITVAVQLKTEQAGAVDGLLEGSMLAALERVIRLDQQLLEGSLGTLTDLQVTNIRASLQDIKRTQQLLYELRAEQFSPAVMAPQPYPVAELFGFQTRDFVERRIQTHRLRIESTWSDEQVYCYAALRHAVERLVRKLLLCIPEEAAVYLSDQVRDDGAAVQVALRYRTRDPEMLIAERILPLALPDPARFESTRSIERLISSVHAWLRPLHGQAWGEPCDDQEGCVTLVLPRWKPVAPIA